MAESFSFPSWAESPGGSTTSTFDLSSKSSSSENVPNITLTEFETEINRSSSNNCEDSFALGESSSNGQRENTSVDNEVILSVYWKRGKLGASYFTTSESEVHVLNDVVDVHPDFRHLKCLLNQVPYTQIITCTNLAESFTKALKSAVGKNDACESEEFNDILVGEDTFEKLHFIPGKKSELNYDSCKRLILGQRFSFEPKFTNEEEHLLFINTHIDLKKESAVMSLGILIKYLGKYIPKTSLNRDAFHITMLQFINLGNLVSIDDASYKALQIFNVIHHPSAFKRSDIRSDREGLSVFGIFNRCKSRIGAKNMRQIFMNPTKDTRELNSRLDAVEFCCKPNHEHIVKNLMDCIKKIESVTGILTSIYRSRSKINHWKSLYSSVYNAILIGQICMKYSSYSELFLRVAQSITKNVHEVAHYINHVIDFEESFSRNQFTVRVGIDNKLDRVRQTYAQVSDVLVKVAELELKDLPEYLGQCCIVYITELGYLLSVPVWKGDGNNTSEYQLPNFDVKRVGTMRVLRRFPNFCETEEVLKIFLTLASPTKACCWCKARHFSPDRAIKISEKLITKLNLKLDFKFIVNNHVYYKTPRCSELDNFLGDVLASICKIESKIMVALMEFIHERVPDIVRAVNLIAELDCIIAMAGTASENNYTRPILTNDRKIEIIKGRHPLQELCVDNFVPNDAFFTGESNTITILTGPNASGKSVYLKQIAVIAFLAHIGSFVPAQKAEINILDHIHSRIHTLESISTRMSSFILDLRQMSQAIYNSTPSSLIIIDEFGKGTTEIDGLALLAASLIHFAERKENCPFILVSTHFHKLSKLLPDIPLINLQYMDYIVENEEIVYLHRIKSGTCSSSLSHLAAKSAGMNERSVKRFLEIQSLDGRPLLCNPSLEITKFMLKEVKYMTDLLGPYEIDKGNNTGKKGELGWEELLLRLGWMHSTLDSKTTENTKFPKSRISATSPVLTDHINSLLKLIRSDPDRDVLQEAGETQKHSKKNLSEIAKKNRH